MVCPCFCRVRVCTRVPGGGKLDDKGNIGLKCTEYRLQHFKWEDENGVDQVMKTKTNPGGAFPKPVRKYNWAMTGGKQQVCQAA